MEFVYGINPAFEVIMSNRRKIFGAFICDTGKPKIKKICNLLQSKGIEVQHVDKGQLINMTGNKYHQGVVLKVSAYPYVPFDSMIGKYDKLLLLDNIEDPQNLGAILRSCEVFGFKAVLLSMRGTPEVYSSVVKVSSGATEHLQIANDHNANAYAKKAKENGYKAMQFNSVVKTNTPACKLYEKIGFKIVGEVPEAFHSKFDTYEPVYILYKKL